MYFSKVLARVGFALIWFGSIILLFVAYQLWGTNLAESRAQDDLESEFEAALADLGTPGSTSTAVPVTLAPDTSTSSTSTTTAVTLPPPPPDDGEAIARLAIPAIDVDKIVVEGVRRSDLQKGPGHYPDTPLPGQPGNAAIAGHRTTYGAPFHNVDKLQAGDKIFVTTLQGEFTYEVSSVDIVRPSQVEVVEDKGDNRLTLTSCHPKYSAAQRIIVSALLVDNPAPPPTTDPAPTPTTIPVEEGILDLDSLDAGESRTIGPALVWGSVVLAVWIAFYVLSRRWRRWPAYLLGVPPFGVALFIFFGALTHALPANF